MALLICPECDKKFSSHAEMCPECGCPTAIAESWKGRLPIPEPEAAPASSSGQRLSSMPMRNAPAAHSEKPPPSSDQALDLGNGVIMRFALIPAGEFLMGSPASEKDRGSGEIQHKVTISKPFYMGIHQVTQAQYKAVMDENPSRFKGDTLPMENVSWFDAMEFCVTLSTQSGRTVRLPTEAEWEYACRAGTTTPFSFGEIISTKSLSQ